MILCYTLVSIFLFIFTAVHSTPVRDSHVFDKIPLKVEKGTKLSDIPNRPKDGSGKEGKTSDGTNEVTNTENDEGKIASGNSDAGNSGKDDNGNEGKNTENEEEKTALQHGGNGKSESDNGSEEKNTEGEESPGNDEDGKIKENNAEKDDKSNNDETNDDNEKRDSEYDEESTGYEGEDTVSDGTDNDPTKLKDQNNQRDMAFKKYHAEKVAYVQDSMASDWPLGIIPYNFDTSSFDNILAVRVRDAMDFLESASCVKFKAISGRTPENYTWIHITNPEKQRECSHKPRRKRNGEIVIILGLDCLKRRDILHSLLHAIGFHDEVAHPHRDQYIRIMWENIQPKYQRLFSVVTEEHKMLVEYDPMSIMHFHDRAFSKNGQATIVPLMPGLQIQPSDKLSQLDKMKLRLAFGHECNRRTVDDLFDTCKTVMHENTKGEAEDKDYDVGAALEAFKEDYKLKYMKKNSENEVGNDNNEKTDDKDKSNKNES